ncbi:wolframin-like [Centruroides sculpturatus]|uniref:wolframin-like n=1 Tax=Centruroides sculpturatus TaxID=218467 RepID=UPI000C6EA403|nr:wolframin-like [Centruroides sculpturatus]XP_023218896.1 wolframin-like [Centruroides sculpturatus]
MQRKPYSREMWQFEQRSKFSFHRLRHQLAEDGCKESQVSLARTLLREKVIDKKEKCENEKVAVHWLLRAASQGYEEASDLLDECYRNGTGITSSNKEKVEMCLNRTEKEKLAYQLGHKLFKIVAYDTNEILLLETFKQKIYLFIKDVEEGKSFKDTIPEIGFSNTNAQKENILNGLNRSFVTVNDVVSSVFQCLEGDSPSIYLAGYSMSSTSLWRILQWFLKIFYRISNELLRIIYIQSISLAMILCALSFCLFIFIFSPQYIFFKYLVCLVSLMSLIVMIFSTGYMISIIMQYYNFRFWLKVIKSLEQSNPSVEIVEKHSKMTLFCFFMFFISLSIFLLTYPMNLEQIAHADVAVLSVLLIYYLEKESKTKSGFRMLTLAFNILIASYKVAQIENKELNIVNLTFTWKITKCLEMNFNIISSLYCIIIFLYYKIIHKSKGKWYQFFLPHLMSLAWLNITAFLLERTQSKDLSFSVILLMFIIIIAQFFPICLAISLCYIGKSLLIGISFWNLLLLIVVASMFTGYSFLCHYFSTFLNKSEKLRTFIFVISVLSLLFLFGGLIFMNFNNGPVLTWDRYQNYCHRPAWERTNMAEVEAACTHLLGSRLGGEGKVLLAKITDFSNPLKNVINKFPTFLLKPIKCILGSPYRNCQQESHTIKYERCLLYNTVNTEGCHLEDWNVYRFEITLSMINSEGIEAEAIIMTDGVCKNFVMNIRNGDHIQFIGILQENPGSLQPKLKLEMSVCESCDHITICDYNQYFFFANWPKVMKFYVQFFFFPLIIYSPENTNSSHL